MECLQDMVIPDVSKKIRIKRKRGTCEGGERALISTFIEIYKWGWIAPFQRGCVVLCSSKTTLMLQLKHMLNLYADGWGETAKCKVSFSLPPEIHTSVTSLKMPFN